MPCTDVRVDLCVRPVAKVAVSEAMGPVRLIYGYYQEVVLRLFYLPPSFDPIVHSALSRRACGAGEAKVHDRAHDIR